MKLKLTSLLLFIGSILFSQTFTKITSSSNPIATDLPTMGYAGASWVDYDGDGDIDLFVNQDFLYRNDGAGDFTRILDSGIDGVSIGYNNGNAWGDIDNDGDMDMVLTNREANGVFTNNGDGTFTRINSGDIAQSLNAWSPVWADYDNDGFLDLVATHACGGTGSPCHTNWLFHNNGDGTFEEITNSDVTTGFDSYTVANWTDFDDDGDMDLFIGSGEVNAVSTDHIYINQLMETGTADLERKTDGSLFGDVRDGQNWNFIDYDNDGDLDAFVTNFKSDVVNDFYKNNGDGTFSKLTESELGTHIASEPGVWLANVWGDFNNDGWIDIIMTADFGSQFSTHMYLNDGDGTFTHHFPTFTSLTGCRSATIGDYDDDGDLDIFINSTDAQFRGLFRNNLDPGTFNDENWVNISLEGTVSNRSAIGAKVRVKANLDGQSYWQMREISSQNTFAGHNSMRVHFGLGLASTIDSLVIEWPLGLSETYTDVPANQFHKYTEGMTTGIFEGMEESLAFEVFPNPFVDKINVDLSGFPLEDVHFKIFNSKGQLIKNGEIPKGKDLFEIALPSSLSKGVFWVKISSSSSMGIVRAIKVE